MRINKILCLLLLSLGLSETLWGGPSPQDRFTESIAHYDQGQFRESAEILEKLLEEGLENGHIYYNLGNALYRLDRRGQAIAAWLKARSLLPRDPDIEANLSFATSLNRDRLDWNRPVSAGSVLTFWLSWTTPREVFAFAALLFLAGMTGLILSRLRTHLRALKHSSLSLLAASLPGFLAFSLSLNSQPHWGAVEKDQASVHSGPGESNTVVFELHEGSPVNVRLSDRGWYLIELSDGKRGWVSGDHIRFFP